MAYSIELDNDIYEMTQKISHQTNQPINLIVTTALRQFFNQMTVKKVAETKRVDFSAITGIEPFTTGKNPVTNEQVNAIREQEGI